MLWITCYHHPAAPTGRRLWYIMNGRVCALLDMVPQSCCGLNGGNNHWVQPDTQWRLPWPLGSIPGRVVCLGQRVDQTACLWEPRPSALPAILRTRGPGTKSQLARGRTIIIVIRRSA